MNFRPERVTSDMRIELTPLIDVVFQLLIFFLLTTSFIEERALAVDLPESKIDARSHQQVKMVAVTIGKGGALAHDGKRISLDGLAGVFQSAGAADRKQEVMIRGDRAVPHGRVVEVMDLARRHGLTKVAIATALTDVDDLEDLEGLQPVEP